VSDTLGFDEDCAKTYEKVKEGEEMHLLVYGIRYAIARRFSKSVCGHS